MPGMGEGAMTLRQALGARRRGDLRDARCDRGGRQSRGRHDGHVVARHPRLARAQRRGDHLHHLRLVGVPHPRCAADGVAGRPVPAWAHHRVLEPLLRSDDGADRLATSGVALFFARLGVGSTKSNTFTVQSTLLADTYPITSRGRIGSTLSLFGSVTGTLSPLIVGGLATWIGGPSGWRWVFIMLSIPICIVSIFGFLPCPNRPRGQFEKQDVLGEVIEEDDPLPISVEAAFARLLQIRTLKAVITAFAAIGFGLFTVPILGNLFMEDEYGLGSFGRGAVGTVSGVAVMITVPFVGKFYDGQYRKDPARALRFVGWLVLPSALLVPVQYFMPNPVVFAILAVPTAVMTVAAYAMVGPLLTSVIPYRLRGMGQALGALYIFFIGATGGALLAGLLSNAYGTRAAIIVLYVPATIVGGALMLRSASFIHDDLRLVSRELREEQDEHRRRMDDPDHVAALQVSQVDFSYGQVQILFDVGFEVRKGEVLALLGTNGAGKSTILRVIAGLGTPCARRRSAPRTHHHLRHAGDADPVGDPHVAGRQGRLQRPVDPREPRGRGVQPAQGPHGDERRHRRRAGDCSRSWPSDADVRRFGAVRWSAADAGARPGAHHRDRHLDHRRTLARARPDHGRTVGEGHRTAPRAGHDDHRRRAVAQRRHGHRRPSRVPREGPCPIRG